METYDILMIVVLVGATLFGAIKGFAWQLASIGSIVVSYMVAYNFREPVSQSIQAEPPWNRFLAMLILYVGTSLVIWVAFRMVSRSIDRLRLREFDRQVGAIFGLAKGALYCTLITLFAVTLLGDVSRQKIVASRSGRYISRVLDRSEAVIPPEIHEVVQPYLDRFDQRFRGEENEGWLEDGGSGPVREWIENPPWTGPSSELIWNEADPSRQHSPLPVDPRSFDSPSSDGRAYDPGYASPDPEPIPQVNPPWVGETFQQAEPPPWGNMQR